MEQGKLFPFPYPYFSRCCSAYSFNICTDVPEENKTVFNDGNYEELKLGTLTINGCDPYDILRTFNGKLSIAQSKPIKESYSRLSVEELFKTYGLKYYTQKQKEEAVNSALNERQATASVGGF